MFLSDRKIESFIDRYKNPQKDIITGILQSSLILPVLFFIYISKVFDIVTITLLEVTSILFMDNLRFLTSNNSNVATYNIAKIKAILFFTACCQKVKEEILASKLIFGE